MDPAAKLSLLALSIFALAACQDQPAKPAENNAPAAASATSAATTQSDATPEDKALLTQAQGLFQPLPSIEELNKTRTYTDAQVKLGHQLWYEPRLSRGNTVSCNTCHNLATAGVDNLPTSQGHTGQLGVRNSPTALNAALLGSQFWDGRAADVEEQAGGPLLNPVEMANVSEEAVVEKIANIPEYQAKFKEAYADNGGAISFANITTAIAAFERTLMTPSRWDEYLKGDVNALNPQERKGLSSFINNGCIACHTGVNLGGTSFQKFGLVNGPYWKFTGSKGRDEGRFEVTKAESDKYLFRVPGMRNVANTYPYFHDGSVWTLEEAVSIMGQAQLGKQLPKDEVADIVAFFGSLSGSVSEAARTVPELPFTSNEQSRPNNEGK